MVTVFCDKIKFRYDANKCSGDLQFCSGEWPKILFCALSCNSDGYNGSVENFNILWIEGCWYKFHYIIICNITVCSLEITALHSSKLVK